MSSFDDFMKDYRIFLEQLSEDERKEVEASLKELFESFDAQLLTLLKAIEK